MKKIKNKRVFARCINGKYVIQTLGGQYLSISGTTLYFNDLDTAQGFIDSLKQLNVLGNRLKGLFLKLFNFNKENKMNRLINEVKFLNINHVKFYSFLLITGYIVIKITGLIYNLKNII